MPLTGWLLSLVTLAFVMSVTPGPNNLLFAASGSSLGYLRSLPILAGMLAGFAAVIGACVAGVGALVNGSPRAASVLTVLAAAYMAWIGVHLWSSDPPGPREADDAAPTVSWLTMGVLQAVNPKTWLASATLVSGSLGVHSPGGHRADVVGVAVFLGVVSCSASLWTLFGAAARGALGSRRLRHWNRLLSVLSLGTALGFVLELRW